MLWIIVTTTTTNSQPIQKIAFLTDKVLNVNKRVCTIHKILIKKNYSRRGDKQLIILGRAIRMNLHLII